MIVFLVYYIELRSKYAYQSISYITHHPIDITDQYLLSNINPLHFHGQSINQNSIEEQKTINIIRHIQLLQKQSLRDHLIATILTISTPKLLMPNQDLDNLDLNNQKY